MQLLATRFSKLPKHGFSRPENTTKPFGPSWKQRDGSWILEDQVVTLCSDSFIPSKGPVTFPDPGCEYEIWTAIEYQSVASKACPVKVQWTYQTALWYCRRSWPQLWLQIALRFQRVQCCGHGRWPRWCFVVSLFVQGTEGCSMVVGRRWRFWRMNMFKEKLGKKPTTIFHLRAGSSFFFGMVPPKLHCKNRGCRKRHQKPQQMSLGYFWYLDKKKWFPTQGPWWREKTGIFSASSCVPLAMMKCLPSYFSRNLMNTKNGHI